jgi:hypothetical protein
MYKNVLKANVSERVKGGCPFLKRSVMFGRRRKGIPPVQGVWKKCEDGEDHACQDVLGKEKTSASLGIQRRSKGLCMEGRWRKCRVKEFPSLCCACVYRFCCSSASNPD